MSDAQEEQRRKWKARDTVDIEECREKKRANHGPSTSSVSIDAELWRKLDMWRRERSRRVGSTVNLSDAVRMLIDAGLKSLR